jgi:hypothetical protein
MNIKNSDSKIVKMNSRREFLTKAGILAAGCSFLP